MPSVLVVMVVVVVVVVLERDPVFGEAEFSSPVIAPAYTSGEIFLSTTMKSAISADKWSALHTTLVRA